MSTSHLIRLIAPSGYCHNQIAAERAVTRLREWGHTVENTEAITRRFQRFAGNDAERLQDINGLARLDHLPDIILAIRGGYGVTRLLDQVDFAGLRQRFSSKMPIICGHSDFTALQLALLAKSGLVTFSGPMLSGNFGAETLSDFTLEHFWRAITSPTVTLQWQSATPDVSPIQGTVWGGNLAMIMTLVGTPWLPTPDNGILVIEDVNEHPFRTERMLLQLHHSGILARQRAIVTGSFTGANLTDYDNGFNFDTVWQTVRDITGLPVISGLDFGHDHDTVTLPLGAKGEVQVNQGMAQLTLTGHPILR
ncbi:Muramoyltetrapeptide carboxypeptidase [Paramixta manurensis]|uniref:Muramoyltetrapeptide carboxypeptidase n=1 Tax=Paramixta manurensis TaxID=2740817 RepID=A0A6M8UEB3_9GAMM|nr:Muramoyltetrapeptide carboxypeptidase [Erwiniaceae bacterium PD-1]